MLHMFSLDLVYLFFLLSSWLFLHLTEEIFEPRAAFCVTAFSSTVRDERCWQQSRGTGESASGSRPMRGLQPGKKRLSQTQLSVQQVPLQVSSSAVWKGKCWRNERKISEVIYAFFSVASYSGFCEQHSFLYKRTALPLTDRERSIFRFQK